MTDLVDQVDGRGLAMSPTLPDECKNFLIDIDGTICEDVPNEQPERMEDAELFDGVVEEQPNKIKHNMPIKVITMLIFILPILLP